MQGDRIISVDDAAVDGLSVFAVESMLFGLVGTRVSITLGRVGEGSGRAQSSAQRVFKVQLVRDTDRALAAHDKLNIHRAMQQSAAQAWAHSKFSVIHEEERMAGLSLPELMAAFRKGRVTRQSPPRAAPAPPRRGGQSASKARTSESGRVVDVLRAWEEEQLALK